MKDFSTRLPEGFTVPDPERVEDYVARAGANSDTAKALGKNLHHICRTLKDYMPEGTTANLGLLTILDPDDVPRGYPKFGAPSNWLILDIHPPCGALQAMKRLGEFEERELYPLYNRPGQDFDYLLHLALPDIPDELVEHDSEVRIREAGDEP